jgi:hypothetical protein
MIESPALEIPASFSRLSALEELTLFIEKDLVLPERFGDLSSLKELFLGYLQTIPDSINGCKNLKLVFISSDKLLTRPESFGQIKKLEELHLETSALKALPNAFGSLAALKSASIFSGAMISLPESIGNLKNLKSLRIDAYNLENIPESFKKLSYVKDISVQTGKGDKSKRDKKGGKKRKIAEFEEFGNMSFSYRRKLFENYSLKEIESILCSAPHYSPVSYKDKQTFREIMLERNRRLNRKFKWTDANKKRIAKVSDEFLKAWEEGFAKAKTMIEALYEKEQGKNPVGDNCLIEIILYPEILRSDKEQLFDIMTDYISHERELSINVNYDPLTKSEEGFRKNIFIKRDLSWNIEGFGDIDLEGYHICYALHILYSHNEWANEDICRINNIACEVKVTWDRDEF